MPRSPSRLGRYDSCGEPGGLEAAFYLRCARLRTLERLWRVSPHVYLVSRLSEAPNRAPITSAIGTGRARRRWTMRSIAFPVPRRVLYASTGYP